MIIGLETVVEAQPLSSDEVNEAVRMSEKRPAPPLTKLIIASVASSKHPRTESISQSQMLTIYDHGGSKLYVGVLEIGYGHLVSGSMDGQSIDKRNITSTTGVCIDTVKNVYSLDCKYKPIIGWFEVFNLSGFQSGTFKITFTSDVVPYIQKSDFLTIK